MNSISSRLAAALACAVMTATPVLAYADTIKIPEGTELPMRLEEKLSSKTSSEGDKFAVSLAEDVRLADGTILKKGYRGVGEIIHLKKSGMMGKSGEMNVRLTYLRVGDERIRLRASKGVEGKGNTGNQIVGVVLIGVFAAVIKGHNVDLAQGSSIMAYADQDTELTTPLADPPPAV